MWIWTGCSGACCCAAGTGGISTQPHPWSCAQGVTSITCNDTMLQVPPVRAAGGTYSLSGRFHKGRFVGRCALTIGGTTGHGFLDGSRSNGVVQVLSSGQLLAMLCQRCYMVLGCDVCACPSCPGPAGDTVSRWTTQRRKRARLRGQDDFQDDFQDAVQEDCSPSPRTRQRPDALQYAISRCTVLDDERGLLAVPRRVTTDLHIGSGSGTYCNVVCGSQWYCSACGDCSGT